MNSVFFKLDNKFLIYLPIQNPTQFIFQIELPNGKKAVEKYIHVEVTCHVRLENIGGGIENDHLINVYGLAIVRKDPGQREAKVIRLENVSLESQLNLFFTQTDTDLAFLPV